MSAAHGAQAERPHANRRSVVRADEIITELLGLDPALGLRSYYGERSVFFNPGRVAPLGAIFVSFKDADGPNDSSSRLSRPGVYRLAFQMTSEDYEERFGTPPARPPKGGLVDYDFDPAELDRVLPHPVYAWMRWVQVLSPSAETLESVRPEILRSLDGVRAKWHRRKAAA